MSITTTSGAGAGLFIPLQYAEGSSVDLIYMQAMTTISELAKQQFRMGLTRLFDSTPALAGFVLRLQAEGEKFDLLPESIELAAKAPDDTRLVDVKNAIAAFVDGAVSVLIYQEVNGRRYTRDDIAAGGEPVALRPIAASGRKKGLGSDEEGIDVAGITLVYPRDVQPAGYIRMLDSAGEESLFLDTAIAHADPAFVIRIFVDLFRSLAAAGYPGLTTATASGEHLGLAEVA